MPVKLLLLSCLAFSVSCGDSGNVVAPDPPAPTLVGLSAETSAGPHTVGGNVNVVVTANGSNGVPLPGVKVGFGVVDDLFGGSVSPTEGITGPAGTVTTSWTLGTAPGEHRMVAVASGASGSISNSIAATVLVGPAAEVLRVSGDEQTGAAGTTLGGATVVAVVDQFGNEIVGADVTFTVTSGGGFVDQGSVATGADGQASAFWTLGATAGIQTLQAQAGVLPAVGFSATAVVEASAFNIEIRAVGTLSPEVQAAFEAAAARWEEIITEDLEAFVLEVAANSFCGIPAMEEEIDDLVIFAEAKFIDGPGNIVAQAGQCWTRTNGLPLVGIMRFDPDDIAPKILDGTFNNVVLHEMGHVLGIGGNAWTNFVRNTETANPIYTGVRGIFQYAVLGGGASGSVPVENVGGPGTRGVHWRTSTFQDELMVATIAPAMKLSILTIGSLLDLGYGADLSKADQYVLPRLGATRLMAREEGWEVLFLEPRVPGNTAGTGRDR